MQAEDGIRDYKVTGVQTCALPICGSGGSWDDGGALSEAASSASQGFDMPGIDGLDEGAVVLVPVLLVFAALLVAVTGAGSLLWLVFGADLFLAVAGGGGFALLVARPLFGGGGGG